MVLLYSKNVMFLFSNYYDLILGTEVYEKFKEGKNYNFV